MLKRALCGPGVQRGITMIIALIVVAILLVVALTVLGEAINSSQNTTSVANKSAAFNAVDGGLSAAIDILNHNVGPTQAPHTCVTPTPSMNNVTVSAACVEIDNTAGATAQSTPDPATNKTISVPAGYAYVDSYISGSAVAHRTFVEALVTKQQFNLLPTVGLNGQDTICDNYNGSTTITSDVHANNAIIQCNGGSADVVGHTSGYNYNNVTGTQGTYTKNTTPAATQISFPSASQMSAFKQAALEAAQSGTTMTPTAFASTCASASPAAVCQGNIYVSGDVSLSSSSIYIGGTAGGTLYINGNVTLSGNGTTIDNLTTDTMVVTGSVSVTGQASYQNPTQKGSLIVYGTDATTCVQTISPPTVPNPNPTACAVDMGGNAKPSGLVYAPFGSINLHGNGNEVGSFDAGTTPAQTGGEIYLNGGGSSGGFTSSPSNITNPPSGLYAIKSYWEY